MDKQQEFVLRTVEERDIRFVRLWFTDVLGLPEVGGDRPGRARGRLRRGHRLRRLGDRGASPGCRRPTCSPSPDPRPSRCCRGAGVPGRRADVLRHPHPDGAPVTPTRGTCSSAPSRGPPTMGFTFYTHPEIEFFLFKDAPAPTAPSRSTTAATSTTPRTDVQHDFRRQAITMLERWASRSSSATTRSPRPARDRPALRRRAHDGRQHHDLPARGQGGRARAGRLRDVHAQAARRPPRQRDAHPPVAVRGRPQRLLRGRRRVPAVRRRRGVHRRACCATPARSPRSPTSGSTPTSGWPAAARRRRTCAGATTTAARWSACRCTSRARGNSTRIEYRAPSTRLQPLPRLRAAARRRAQGHRGGLRAAARRRGRRVGAHRRPSGARSASSRCRPASTRPSRSMERSELVAETLGEHVFDFFLRNKRRSGTSTGPGDAVRARPLPADGAPRRARPAAPGRRDGSQRR
jgi:glutamine synthetase